jgi:hypothetical protein
LHFSQLWRDVLQLQQQPRGAQRRLEQEAKEPEQEAKQPEQGAKGPEQEVKGGEPHEVRRVYFFYVKSYAKEKHPRHFYALHLFHCY